MSALDEALAPIIFRLKPINPINSQLIIAYNHDDGRGDVYLSVRSRCQFIFIHFIDIDEPVNT